MGLWEFLEGFGAGSLVLQEFLCVAVWGWSWGLSGSSVSPFHTNWLGCGGQHSLHAAPVLLPTPRLVTVSSEPGPVKQTHSEISW